MTGVGDALTGDVAGDRCAARRPGRCRTTCRRRSPAPAWRAFRGSEGLVVDGVLGEGSELLEGRVHAARPRVKSRVVIARRFVDRLGIGRQFIPETVKIDALAAGHQRAPCRGRGKLKCQSTGLVNLVPRPDAGQRRVHRHPTCRHGLGTVRRGRSTTMLPMSSGDEVGLRCRACRARGRRPAPGPSLS